MIATIIMTNKTPATVSRVAATFAEAGYEAYAVGGYIRDRLLGRPTADLDIAVKRNALEAGRLLAAALGGTFVCLDAVNRIARITLREDESHWQVDLATFDGTIYEDLARRDFTINAMATPLAGAADLNYETIIDPFGGRADLDRRLICAVSDSAFRDDPARLMRAVRLAAELGFQLDPGTVALIRRDAATAASVAGERLREELLRLLAVPGSARWLNVLDSLGLLTTIVPELIAARGVEQPGAHYWDVYQHSLNTVAAVEFVLREGFWEHANIGLLSDIPWTESVAASFAAPVSTGSTRGTLLKLAALLHDIAKPETKSLDEQGFAHFLGHPSRGSEISTALMERLRFSARETGFVSTVVTDHLRPSQMSHEGMPTHRAIYRFFRDTGDAGIPILYLALADYLATHGPDLDLTDWRRQTSLVDYVMREHSHQDELTAGLARLLDGRDLMAAFDLLPGKTVGDLLAALTEAQAAGEITNREQALELARHILESTRRTG